MLFAALSPARSRSARRRPVALSAVTATVSAVLITVAPQAAAGPTVLTDAQIVAMSPGAQAEYMAPLSAAADALSTVGKSASGSRIFSVVVLDPNHYQVDLYVTDPAQAASMITAAKELSPSIDIGLVQVRKAAYTIQELDAARLVYLSQKHSFEIYAIGPAPDGSGLDVEVANPKAAARQSSAAASSVKIILKLGFRRVSKVLHISASGRGTQRPPVQPDSPGWAAVKWHDSSPFIGGDVITPDGHGYCTTGLPTVRTSDRHPIMITAAHCFGIGQQVYTGGGPTWSWGNGQTGNFVGAVTSKTQHWDAETLDGANNNADESDNEGWIPLTSVGYSYINQFVCHSGARSAYFGHGTPCGIKVTNPDLLFPVEGYNARGVEGVDVVNGWGSVQGDSGGIVFALTSGNTNREARGIVSAGGADGTPDQKRVDWVEAPDIFRAYGLQLNPVT